jgi:hypothetical protein
MNKIFFPILIVLLTLFAACSKTELPECSTRIAILQDSLVGTNFETSSAIASVLKLRGFETDFLSAEQVCDSTKLSAKNYFLYVIPNVETYPENGEEALTNFVQQKGSLMVLGAHALPGQPLFETLSPSYKMYPMNDISSLKVVDGQGVFLDKIIELPVPDVASSCFKRPSGKGFETGYSFRWIPIISAHDKTGLERGTAAWMLLNQAPIEQDEVFKDALRRIVATTAGNVAKNQLNNEGSVFAVCAINDDETLQELAQTSLFGDMAQRISKGVFLSHAGANEFSYWQGEKMELGAALVNYGKSTAQLEVKITVTSQSDKTAVYEETKTIELKPNEKVKTKFGEMVAEYESGGYQVKTELYLHGECVDVIDYEVGMLSSKIEPRDEFITVEGTQFKNKGKNWNPVGANYWPRNAIATEQIDYLYNWLTPGYYEPEQVDDDLQRLEDMGANFVAIRANYINDRRTVLDFMRRCRNHNIFVYLLLQKHEVEVEPHYFEGIMMPFHFEKEMVTEFIEETRINENPALMSWDLIWEPSNWLFQDSITFFGWNGDPNFRGRFDPDWEAWINERYGSIKNAETDWGISVPRTKDGAITSPSNKQFEEDGKWRIMMAAYRRFQNDLMNRQYNDACRIIRELDPNHLISYRQGNLPPTDYTLTSTLKHVDFFSMEAYSFPPLENGRNKVGFVNRYLSYALPNKPFMWNEYGYGGPWGQHTRHLDGEDVEYQFEYVDMVNSEAYKNGANGIAPWWFAGGLRASEKTDFGITTPEGTLRPSGESVKKYGEMYRTAPPSRPKPDKWMTIDLDAHSGGLWHVTNTFGADAYEKATAEGKTLGIRTTGTGTTSVNTPLLAVGNTKYNGNNPPKYLNAEFNWTKIKKGNDEWRNIAKGEELKVSANTPVSIRISVGNTQEASWVAPENMEGEIGSVFLCSTDNSDLSFKIPIKKSVALYDDTDFGGSFQLTKGITKKTVIELQMTAKNRAWFGEKMQFVLVPE